MHAQGWGRLEFRKARICAYPSILMSLAVRLLVSTPVTVLLASSEAMFRAAKLTVDSDWARDAVLCASKRSRLENMQRAIHCLLPLAPRKSIVGAHTSLAQDHSPPSSYPWQA